MQLGLLLTVACWHRRITLPLQSRREADGCEVSSGHGDAEFCWHVWHLCHSHIGNGNQSKTSANIGGIQVAKKLPESGVGVGVAKTFGSGVGV